MVNHVFNFEISPELAKYLKKIEIETERQIKVIESPDLGLKGMWAAFKYHPKYILIILRSDVRTTHPDLERSIAHEATHGYLIFKKEYCRPVFKPFANENDKKNVSLIFTMIDDIVVNKIIQINGFHPSGSEYLPMVKKETKIAVEGKGEDFYSQFSEDNLFDTILMISRYMIAWGFLEYFNLEHYEREVIGSFIESFQKSYPQISKIVNHIKKIILENDIFSREGQCQAIYQILKLWDLENMVKLDIT